MVPLAPDEFAAAMTAYVDPHAIPDYAFTGLQVGGERRIRRLAVAVSANLGTFEEAARWGADAVLVHHGLFWASEEPVTDPTRQFDERRAAFLREHGMSLLAYHLPLDAHPEVGNNIELARRLGLGEPTFDFAPIPGSAVAVGLVAKSEPAIPLEELVRRAAAVTGGAPAVVPGGPDPIRSIAVLSGGGSGHIYEAIAREVDAYVTGEGREWIPAIALEAGLTFVALGHHASETLGVQSLAAWAATNLGVETRYLPQSNQF
jgi:dinuclear metal center YbgI/SA1388 family protein